MSKTLEEIQQEEAQVQTDLAEYAAEHSTAAPAADLTPEQQTGAAPAAPADGAEVAPETVETAAQPAPEAAATPAPDSTAANEAAPAAEVTVATPDPATTGPGHDHVTVSRASIISQVEGLAKKAWGEAVSVEDSISGFVVKVGDEIKHLFSWV